MGRVVEDGASGTDGNEPLHDSASVSTTLPGPPPTLDACHEW